MKSTDGASYDAYNLELGKDEELKVGLSDNKTIWPNRDKNIFVFINSMLSDGLKCLINHTTCLTEYETIERDIKLREEDDLLQFE